MKESRALILRLIEWEKSHRGHNQRDRATEELCDALPTHMEQGTTNTSETD